MTGFFTNQESGLPSGYDQNKSGSALLGSLFQTHPLFTHAQNGARRDPGQNDHDVHPVGVPGANYSPSQNDKVLRTPGGAFIAVGDESGAIRIQAKNGAAIEIDAEGNIKIVATQGLHIASGGPLQITSKGDIDFATNGDFKVKCNDVHFDCSGHKIHAAGDIIHTAGKDHNLNVHGDSHHTIIGDNSHMVGGDHNIEAAGSIKHQAAQNHTSHGASSTILGAVGQLDIRSRAGITFTSTNNFVINSMQDIQFNANVNILAQAVNSISVTSNGTFSAQSINNMTFTTSANLTHFANAAANLHVTGNTTYTSNNTFKIGAQTGNVEIKSILGKCNVDPAPTQPANVSIIASVGATNAKVQILDSKTDPNSKGSGSTTVTPPDPKHLIDNISDFIATNYKHNKLVNYTEIAVGYDVDDSEGGGGQIPGDVQNRMNEKGLVETQPNPFVPDTNQVSDANNVGGNDDFSGGFQPVG